MKLLQSIKRSMKQSIRQNLMAHHHILFPLLPHCSDRTTSAATVQLTRTPPPKIATTTFNYTAGHTVVITRCILILRCAIGSVMIIVRVFRLEFCGFVWRKSIRIQTAAVDIAVLLGVGRFDGEVVRRVRRKRVLPRLASYFSVKGKRETLTRLFCKKNRYQVSWITWAGRYRCSHG